MKTMISTVAAFGVMIAAISPAMAGSWSLRWTGPHGGVYEGAGKCADGACQSSGTFTGPNGGVWRHAGSARQTGLGAWSGEGVVTGPTGQNWKHNWNWSASGQ